MEFLFKVSFFNRTRGDAHSAITVDIPQGILATLYWADENGAALEEYLPIKSIPLFNGHGAFELSNTMIPEKARTMLARVYNESMVEIVLPELICPLPEEKLLEAKEPKKVIIAASDMHFGGDYFHNPVCRRRAFEVIKELAPDIIVISGDVTDNSNPNEYKQAMEYFDSYFPATPTVIAFGNHDHTPYAKGCTPHYEDMSAFMAWQQARNESLGAQYLSYDPERYTFALEYDGVTYIALNPNEPSNGAIYREDQLTWLDDTLTLCDGDRYRVIATHFHRKDTVSDNRFTHEGNESKKTVTAINDGACGDIIDKHGNILHVSGHCHYTLDTDIPNICFDPVNRVGYINGGCMVWTGVSMVMRREYYQQDRAMGQVVEIYDDYMVIRGIEYVSGKFIPRCLRKIEL